MHIKNKLIKRTVSSIIALCLILTVCSCSLFPPPVQISVNEFEYREVSAPNPMKGFVSLYPEATEDSSLEYIGIKFSDIYSWNEETGGSINTAYLDNILASVADRGNTLILRTYIIYPGHNNKTDTGIYLPEKIYKQLKASGDIYSNMYGGYLLEYPDFNNSELIKYMTDYIAQLGEIYDGHPVIAGIQLGLYGSWGEWNMSGCEKQRCAMKSKNMRKLLDAYTESFQTTKLLARNPSLGNASTYDIGFHDDNFLFNTSDFHTKSPEWKSLLESLDRSYGTLQQFYDFINGCNGNYEPIWDKWQTQMFGGELSGLMYSDCFGSIFEGTEREALDYCIEQFHMSWLSGTGKSGIPSEDSPEYQEYLEVARSFGYEIGITEVSSKERTGKLTVTFTNYGIAPFYYDWELEYSLIDKDGNIAWTYRDNDFALSKLLPDESMKSEIVIPESLDSGEYTVTLRFVNPAEGFVINDPKPMKLANNNAIQDGVYEVAAAKIR